MYKKRRIYLKNDVLRQLLIFNKVFLEYSNDRICKIPMFNKHKYNDGVFYLKVNRNDNISITCLQHWIDIVEEIGADFFIICDNKKLEEKIISQIKWKHFSQGNIIKSCKNKELKKIVKNIASPCWENATYAHLTTYYHAIKHGINKFWNIDADDTMMLLEPQKAASILLEVQNYAQEKDIENFSLDMHVSRCNDKVWTFGVTYSINPKKYFDIFKNVADTSWRNSDCIIDKTTNLDSYMTFLQKDKKYSIDTFYIENLRFIHIGGINTFPFLFCQALSYWENNFIHYPIITSVYNILENNKFNIGRNTKKFDFNLSKNDVTTFCNKSYLYKKWLYNFEAYRGHKMKIIKLMGGLGNQMFQWAFGYALYQKNNDNVLYDLTWFDEISKIKDDLLNDQVIKRFYELDCFNIKLKVSTQEQNQNCLNEKQIRNSYLPHFLRKLLKKDKYKIINDSVLEKYENVYEPELLELDGDKYYEGYFQCEKYFKEYRQEILKLFTLKLPLNEQNQKMLEQIKSCNSVSLHIRHGDYLNLKDTFGICSLEYYKKAIEYITSKVTNPHFFLFSDDIGWVKENLKINHPYTIVDINSKGCYDLELMKNCKHNIIANSSFSWWGAWLNNNSNKIVIAPKIWFVDGRKTDIVCDDWIKV